MPALAYERVDQRNHNVFKAIRQEGQPLMQNAVVDFGQDIFFLFFESCAQDGTDQGANSTQD